MCSSRIIFISIAASKRRAYSTIRDTVVRARNCRGHPRVLRCMRLLGSLIALVITAQAAPPAERFPSIQAQTLLGKKLALPDAFKGHATVLIIGFTHASQSETKAWSTRLEDDLQPYSIAVLQDVPRLVRRMATSGIKSGVPESRKDHFLLVFHEEKELKEAVGFEMPNDAYVVLLDSNGLMQWKFHGSVSDGTVVELEMRLHALQGTE